MLGNVLKKLWVGIINLKDKCEKSEMERESVAMAEEKKYNHE